MSLCMQLYIAENQANSVSKVLAQENSVPTERLHIKISLRKINSVLKI